jgi:hypothetical protein
MADLKDHIDKVFEQYRNRFKTFEILFTIVVGSGIVFLSVPLGQYYNMYNDLESEIHNLSDTTSLEILRLSSGASNLTEDVARINNTLGALDTSQLGSFNVIDPFQTINSVLSNLQDHILLPYKRKM